MKTTITFRRSTVDDLDAVSDLINQCFGFREDNPLYNIESRYLLAFDEHKLVAMTGIIFSSKYNGLEVDWTGVDKDYRGTGLITNMLRNLLSEHKCDVYCSCWRLYNRKDVNLHFAMKELGFTLLRESHKKYNSKECEVCKVCVNNIGDNCICCEDLYIRYYK